MSNLLPALDAAIEKALRESISRFGVMVPVLVDQHGELVDGYHRVKLAEELGVPVPEQPVQLPDDPEERTAALLSLNDDRRQKLSAEQRREAVAFLRENGHSQRAIAGALGVSRKVVRTDLGKVGPEAHLTDSASVTAEPAEPPRVTGLDGKSYPASKPKPKRTVLRENAHRLRLVDAVSQMYGISRGLERDVNITLAAGACDQDELRQLSAKAGSVIHQLRKVQDEIKEHAT